MRGEGNPMYGRTGKNFPISGIKQSQEHKDKISKSHMGLIYEKKECPYCGKLADPGNFNRWHGDNCKRK
jgi:hypothetical protein